MATGKPRGPPVDFEQYSRDAIHFLSARASPLLLEAVRSLPDRFHLVDLGCGDGANVCALQNAGVLSRAESVTGVDLSPTRTSRFEQNSGYPALISDALRVPQFAQGSLDMVLNAMVIEHVEDEAALLAEVRRLLRSGGLLYVSSVVRRPGAWYFRKAPDGRRVLDPTHVREYPSEEAFVSVLRAAGLVVERVVVTPWRPPLAHPLVRMIHRFRPIPEVHRFFERGVFGPLLERLTIPVPRYSVIEALARSPS